MRPNKLQTSFQVSNLAKNLFYIHIAFREADRQTQTQCTHRHNARTDTHTTLDRQATRKRAEAERNRGRRTGRDTLRDAHHKRRPDLLPSRTAFTSCIAGVGGFADAAKQNDATVAAFAELDKEPRAMYLNTGHSPSCLVPSCSPSRLPFRALLLSFYTIGQDPLLCIYLYTLTITHSHTLLITCTCCYDESKGTKDQSFS